MSPKRHSLVHNAAGLMGLVGGMVVGLLGGGLMALLLGSESKWIPAVGVAVGIAVGVLGASWIVRRFVPAYCPSCGGRMKCRMPGPLLGWWHLVHAVRLWCVRQH